MNTPPLSLIKPSVCPPDGFTYRFPEDGFVAHGWTHTDWVNAARAHLQANQMPEPLDLVQQMETQLCTTLEPGWCNYDDPNRPRVNTSLGWGDIQNGIGTFTRWISGGAGFVGQAEADRRALVCSKCYLNVNVSGCAGCHKAVEQLVRNKKSKYDFALRACAVCKCLLRAKVHFPIDILSKGRENLQEVYPSFCWLKKDGPNYFHVPD